MHEIATGCQLNIIISIIGDMHLPMENEDSTDSADTTTHPSLNFEFDIAINQQ